MFRKIIWATDFSQHARDAGQLALQCARCSDGSLYALSVVDPEDLPVILADLQIPFKTADQVKELDQELESEYEQRVADQLKSEIESIGATSLTVETLIRVGIPWQVIVRTAEEVDASLIVIGSHGKHSLEEIIFGSTVENVTKHAHCPVMVVR